jgi:cell division protein YceG involved in septum cleavage
MAHKPDSRKTLSVKTKLLLIVIMFVVINLVFYFGFDSSDESEKQIELDNQNSLNPEKNVELGEDMKISINP